MTQVWTIKKNQFPRLTDLENELMVSRGEPWGKGIVREFGMDMYTHLYLKWMTNKDLLNSTWNMAHCYMAACLGREFGGELEHVYVWLNLFIVHLNLPQHCLLIGYTPILEKDMATPSSILAPEIPWTEEPGGLHLVHGVAKHQT